MLYFSHLLEDEDTKAVIRETGMGVEAIEFAISENLNHLNEKIFSYQNRLKDMKCKNLILHGPFLDLNPMTFDDKIQAVTRQRYEEAYAAAKTLGAAKIVYHTCYVPDFYLLIGWAERMAAFFEEFLADKDDSIEVLMENVLDRQWEPLKETAKRVQHPAFGLCLDIGHVHCYGEDSCAQWAKELKSYIRHVHIHDNMGNKDSHLALGEGSVDINAVMRELREIPKCTYTIECSTREAVMTSYEILKKYVCGIEIDKKTEKML